MWQVDNATAAEPQHVLGENTLHVNTSVAGAHLRQLDSVPTFHINVAAAAEPRQPPTLPESHALSAVAETEGPPCLSLVLTPVATATRTGTILTTFCGASASWPPQAGGHDIVPPADNEHASLENDSGSDGDDAWFPMKGDIVHRKNDIRGLRYKGETNVLPSVRLLVAALH